MQRDSCSVRDSRHLHDVRRLYRVAEPSQLARGDHSSAKVSIWRKTSSVAVGCASGG
jgi:hypothetical protein